MISNDIIAIMSVCITRIAGSHYTPCVYVVEVSGGGALVTHG